MFESEGTLSVSTAKDMTDEELNSAISELYREQHKRFTSDAWYVTIGNRNDHMLGESEDITLEQRAAILSMLGITDD